MIAATLATGIIIARRTRREIRSEEMEILQGVRKVCKLSTLEMSLADYAKKTVPKTIDLPFTKEPTAYLFYSGIVSAGFDVCDGANGSGDDRPDAFDEVDVEAHADDRGHDVGEHHGRVDAVPAHRLQRHLGAQFGRPGNLPEAVSLAELAVLGQRAPGLAHEPDRRPLDVLTARCPRQKRSHGPVG